MYSNNFTDDDADAKKIIYGFVQTGTLANIFWNNAVNQAFISANSNNTGTLTLNMGSVSAGNLFLSIDRRFYMKLVKFSRATFTGSNELMATQVLETTQSGATGYIQDTGLLSTGGMTKTGNEYVFDFTNNDYALFLSNSAT